LEFTLEADRYQKAYDESWRDGGHFVSSLWQKLIYAYIQPDGPREVNLPSDVRDRLLSLPTTPYPPHPYELNEAVDIVYDLMNGSVLGPFLESVALSQSGFDSWPTRHRMRSPNSSISPGSDEVRSPRSGFLPMLHIGWATDPAPRSGSSSGELMYPEAGLTDDTGSSASPPAHEPVTPPTTPPTSEWGFSTSPVSLHRAISAHNSGWKKVGQKLGLTRKGRSSKRTTSVPSAELDLDYSMGEASHSRSYPV